jgi:chitinase
VFTYSQLVKSYLPTYKRYWHGEAAVPWLYDPGTGVMISYEDPESVGLKAEYVKQRSLGGVMVWELSQDGGELLNSLYKVLYP